MAQYSQTPMFTNTLGFLSNFDETPFPVPLLGREAASGEHAFNALKTLDPAEQYHVLSAPTPGESKGRGRRVTLRPRLEHQNPRLGHASRAHGQVRCPRPEPAARRHR
ncbi:hypothetical protein AB0I46_31830 [Streptomyces spectabilis]|uniref:hypothetical protein n=1 Tax=Streptomyces spectabilis TaxID=68270 RepID=UPI003400869A